MNQIKKQSRLFSIIISYATIITNALSVLIMTRVYLRFFGSDLYGLYQYVYSIAQYAMVMDLGISSVIVRHVGIYKKENNENGIENVLFYCLVIVSIAAIIVLVFGLLLGSNLGFFLEERPLEQYAIAGTLFKIMIAQLMLMLFQHFFEGIALAGEQYVLYKGVMLFRVLFKIAAILILINMGVGIVSIAIGALIATIVSIIICILYIFIKLNTKIKFHGIDRALIQQILVLMSALFIQSIVAYANRAVDKVLLGKMMTNIEVTVYSLGYSLANFFDEIPTIIQSVYLPAATSLVARNASGAELTDFVAKPGRFQFMLVGGMLGGFLLLGKDFVYLWAGKQYSMSWYIALILIIPTIIPVIQNVCLSLLTAMNKRTFRAYLYLSITLANIGLTIFLINEIGIIGAPVATAAALIIGNCIIMNVYYHKAVGIQVLRLFKSIFKGTWMAVLISIAVCFPLVFWQRMTWSVFIIKCLVYCSVYLILLVLLSINREEKAGALLKFRAIMQKFDRGRNIQR